MLSPASGPAVLHQGDDVVSLYVQTASSLWKSSLDGLASSHVLHLTLSGAPKILLYCMEYRRPTTNWHKLCLEGVFVPGHTNHSFVCKSTANFVSAANLIWECPRSLLTALVDKHPDCDIWMYSFWEEKDSIILIDTYDTITLVQYPALGEKGAPRAIPTMCVLTIKPDMMMNPHCNKSCIVVLRNHEERFWSKTDKYAPILRPDTMRLIVSMAVEQQRTLQQGDCKNAFCQGILPLDEITIVEPPNGDPDTKKFK
jgi:hypothetical protein